MQAVRSFDFPLLRGTASHGQFAADTPQAGEKAPLPDHHKSQYNTLS
jgi:hypothetical protein